jgi:S-adenosylmethionine:tRNA ribosyltransferase-isomerase
MKTKELDYFLPKHLIAQKPVRPRDGSRLLACIGDGKKILHKRFRNIEQFFSYGDVLVLNETKVLAAKLFGKKSSGSPCSIIAEKKISPKVFECRVQTNKPRKGNTLLFPCGLKAKIIKADLVDGIFTLRFNKPPGPFLKKFGALPLPPYIKKKISRNDFYQTVFAKRQGSVAAPTAGLHFSKRLLEKLKKRGVKLAKVCLNVGFGTFIPIEVRDLREHKMFSEKFEISEAAAKAINSRKGRLWVCGTTSLRALEASADSDGTIKPLAGSTDIFIFPPYRFKSKPDFLITNFHLPRSTLLALTFAFAGKKRVKRCYREAIRKKYRFYSFGDACLFSRNENSQPQ